MLNIIENFLDTMEGSEVYLLEQKNTYTNIYFIQGKKELICVEKESDKILYKIQLPLTIGLANDTDFVIASKNANKDTNNSKYFTLKNDKTK